MERLIFHIDVNSAFLSWESARRVSQGLPDLREIPSCVGGDPKKRTGIVVAKSIPAKKYGIQTGEPVAMALRKCPNLVIVPSDFELYDKCSRAFKSICASFAPVMESFSIDEVAGAVCLSTSYFSTVFKSETGITFTDYLIKVRMEKARGLLENTSMKMYEISSRAGYENAAYFSAAFKRYYGKSPSEFQSRK